MSLLMDALKRAEENKQGLTRPAEAVPQPENGLSLEPLTATGAPLPQSLPDLATHLDAVDADLAAAVPARQPRDTEPSSSTSPTGREAAQAIFDAKLSSPPSRTPLYITFALLGTGALAIGTYFWWQLQSLSPSSLNHPVAPKTAPPLKRMAPLPAVPNPPPPPSEALASTPSFSSPPVPASVAPPALSMPADASPALRVTRNRHEADTTLVAGWTHLQSGSLDAARREYEKAWQNDPKNVDAILGLAAIAQRQGRTDEADRLQQLALAADPKDASAQAFNIAHLAAMDPQGAESRLKTLLAEQPQSPTLNFAMGNLYARQGRWGEAQQAYFNAVTGDGEHPDYLFNLAISLDRLRQPRLAVQYYRQALDAAAHRAPSFAPEQAQRRLQQLTPTAAQP